MPDRRHRMVKHHPRAGPAHDGADALLHVFAVAVDGTLLACGFVLAEFAAVQPLEGVIQKFGAPAAEFFVCCVPCACSTSEPSVRQLFSLPPDGTS